MLDSPLTLLIIAFNALLTYVGLNNRDFFNHHSFRVGEILNGKDYVRMFSSGFLHVDWTHFGFNMFTLYVFGDDVEKALGIFPFALLYFGSLIGGNLLSLFIQRQNVYYSAVGASGAVTGVVFAAIALFPQMKIGMIFLPIMFPAWLFGIGYVVYSIYGIAAQNDNIGHEAHLGGGITGLIITLAFAPWALKVNTLSVLLILIPSVLFLLIMLFKPKWLLLKSLRKKRWIDHIEDRYNHQKVAEQKELDRILDKINHKGMESLTKTEKDFLKQHE